MALIIYETLSVVILTLTIVSIHGHGRMVSPPGRASMWKYGYDTPKDYQDIELSCGGFFHQWGVNNGKCGVCGDPWDGPRPHEAGGIYAIGIITGHYKTGQNITVTVEITASHRGWFEFRLCPVNRPDRRATQACLDRYLLHRTNGQTRFTEPGHSGIYKIDLILPRGLTCSQCMLQWKWKTGKSWGCDDQQCCLGCGAQEEFYGCADISISK